MTHEEMQSLITSMVQKVQKSSGAGPDAAVEAIVRGLQEYVSEYEADLVESLDYAPGGLDAGADEIRLWQHMYRVLDGAGSKLRYMPTKRKKAKKKATGKAARGARKSALGRLAVRKAMRGT